jgi:hypothetical protein
MTYPGGPGGYPGQGPQQPQPGPYGQPPQQAAVTGVNLPVLLALGVTLLGVVAYFIGFSDEANGVDGQIQLMLVAGLLAVFRALPNFPKFLAVATVISVVAGLALLDAVIGVPESAETPGIVVVLLIMGILQMGVAVVALLFDLGVLKVPTPSPQQYGPPSGGFPQQPPPGQYGPPGGQPYQQPGQYPPPGQQQHPGTPPGGYPQQG